MTVVAHGNTRPAGRDSDALLHQLSQLSHVSGVALFAEQEVRIGQSSVLKAVCRQQGCTHHVVPVLALAPFAVAAAHPRVCGVERHVVESSAARLCSRCHWCQQQR